MENQTNINWGIKHCVLKYCRVIISFLPSILLLTTIFIISSAYSKTCYVSPTGLDSNAGTRLYPWASPGYGSRHIAAGDTLLILGGSYAIHQFDDDIIVPPSGNAEQWTSIIGEPGNRPVLKGSDNLLTAMILSGKSYLRIENIEITSDNGALFRDAIQIIGEGTAEYITLKDLYIHHIDEFGMDFGDINHITIDDCRITYCGFGAIGGPAGEEGGWRNVVIDDCYLAYCGHYYQGGAGLGPYDRPDGFGIEAANGPVQIMNTVAEHNRGDGLDSKAKNTTIQRCIVANNSCDGIKLWGGGSKVENCLIYGRGDGDMTATPWAAIVVNTDQANSAFTFVNNTIDDYLGQNYIIYMQYDNPETPINLVMRNCIFSSRGDNSFIYLAPAVTAVIQYNLFCFPGKSIVLQHGAASYDADHVADIGAGNIYGDPQFLAPAFGAAGDYHLVPVSPAINNGTATGAPERDLVGVPRPQDGLFDMGCYEYKTAPVPVELMGFTAVVMQNRDVLEWQSASECHCYGYILERKTSGANKFSTIHFIPGYGVSTSVRCYHYIDCEPAYGQNDYRLVQVDYDGMNHTMGTVRVEYTPELQFVLTGNYPNPFNAGTAIRFSMPQAEQVSFIITNSTGQQVYALVKDLPAGTHTLFWNGMDDKGRQMASGVYLYRILYHERVSSGKMLLLR